VQAGSASNSRDSHWLSVRRRRSRKANHKTIGVTRHESQVLVLDGTLARDGSESLGQSRRGRTEVGGDAMCSGMMVGEDGQLRWLGCRDIRQLEGRSECPHWFRSGDLIPEVVSIPGARDTTLACQRRSTVGCAAYTSSLRHLKRGLACKARNPTLHSP